MTLKPLKILAGALLFLAGLLPFQSVALADGLPVSMQLTGLRTGFSMGGVYTSPYEITINGKVGVFLACDDFLTPIQLNYTWDATIHPLSAVAGNAKFQDAAVMYPDDPGPTTYSVQQKYSAAAWLAYQLLTNASIWNSPATAGEYSYAIWQIFDPTAVNGYNIPLTHDEKAMVKKYMQDAFAGTASTSIYIFTPNPSTPSQEFIGFLPNGITADEVSVPEGSILTFLAFDFLALPAILLFKRRRVPPGCGTIR